MLTEFIDALSPSEHDNLNRSKNERYNLRAARGELYREALAKSERLAADDLDRASHVSNRVSNQNRQT